MQVRFRLFKEMSDRSTSRTFDFDSNNVGAIPARSIYNKGLNSLKEEQTTYKRTDAGATPA